MTASTVAAANQQLLPSARDNLGNITVQKYVKLSLNVIRTWYFLITAHYHLTALLFLVLQTQVNEIHFQAPQAYQLNH